MGRPSFSLSRLRKEKMNDSYRAGPLAWIIGIGVACVAAVAIIAGLGWLFSFKGTDPGTVCIVQEGGPFDGKGIKEVRQGGEGPKPIGALNKQRCFPNTQRNYTVSAKSGDGEEKRIDVVTVPTKDAVTVSIEGQALFALNTREDVLKAFYRNYGVRTFNGTRPDEGDEGWSNFLNIQFRPVLDSALREAIGQFDCTELVNTCQYVQNANDAVQGKVEKVNNAQNINKAQEKIQQTLQDELNRTLGGPYFQNIRFRLRGVTFPGPVQQQIVEAQAKRTEVAKAQLEAKRQVAEAEGRKEVAKADAEAIREKAKSYTENKAQAQIDKIKALCGEDGCDPQVLGGNVLNQLTK